MDLTIEPVHRTSWPLYRDAIIRLKLPLPPPGARRGIMVVRALPGDVAAGKLGKEAIAGVLFASVLGDLQLLLFAFRKNFTNAKMEAELAAYMPSFGTIAMSLGNFAGRGVLAMPNSESATKCFAEMGFTQPVTLLGPRLTQ